MPKEQVSAEEIAQAVLHRIRSGQLSPGDPLPTVRKLAEEIGSNRNTVNKAYQMLSNLGVIESSESGRRGYIVKQVVDIEEEPKDNLLSYFHQRSVELIWQGMAAGLPAEEMAETLQNALGKVYGLSTLKMIFFECNDHDTIEMGRWLNEELKMPVEYKNLPFFYDDPRTVIQQHDLIITTYHHLAEISETINRLGFPQGKVVGVNTRMSSDTMLRIARFLKTKIGVVSTNQNTAHMIKHVLYGYHPEWDIQSITSEEVEAVKELAQACDHFLVTYTSQEDVRRIVDREPDVIVTFELDEQSVSFLKQRIHEIRTSKMQILRAQPSQITQKEH